MSEMTTAVTAPFTGRQKLYASLLTAASLATAGPAGYEIYNTSTDLARPYLHHLAWILPVACEAAYMVLFGWGILLAWRKMADIPARLAGTFLIAALSFAIQVYAGRHSAADVMVRLAIVASFFVTGMTMKAAFLRMRGGKIRPDRLSLGEWLASPARAAGLWRWKNAWAEPSAETARQRYMRLLYVVALAQATLAQADERAGRTRRTRLGWRKRLPVTLRYELSTGLLPAAITAGGDGWQEAAESHVRDQLALLGARPSGLPETVPEAEPQRVPEPEREPRPEHRPAARPAPASEQAPGPALKLAPGKSRSMSASELEPHVSAMLQAYGTVSQARIKRDLHVSTDKAAEALRLAKRNRTVVQIGAR